MTVDSLLQHIENGTRIVLMFDEKEIYGKVENIEMFISDKMLNKNVFDISIKCDSIYITID